VFVPSKPYRLAQNVSPEVLFQAKHFSLFCSVFSDEVKMFKTLTHGINVHVPCQQERLDLAEAWIQHKDRIPHIVIQVAGTNFYEAKILVRTWNASSLSNVPKKLVCYITL
jgi:hypothetical protein